MFSNRWYRSASFCFLLTCTTGTSRISVEAILPWPLKMPYISWISRHPLSLRAPPLWWDGSGDGTLGLWVLDVALLQPKTTSCAILSEVSQLPLLGSPWMGEGEVSRGEAGWCICDFVLSTGFICHVYWPLRLECYFCSLVTCQVSAVIRSSTAIHSAGPLWASSSVPCSLCYSHLQMSPCAYLSDGSVCWRIPLLNYSYPTCCNFKGRNQNVFSCHHAVDVTPRIFFAAISAIDWTVRDGPPNISHKRNIWLFGLSFYKSNIFILFSQPVLSFQRSP